ncbi:hypothetical protein FRC00_006269 [Tulasnella sp. 408]|nr:hypothetical protein FRC00_006269 [Tulasnella sp. 408]
MSHDSIQRNSLGRLGWLASSKISSQRQTHAEPHIEHLPVELLAKVLLLALPLPDTKALEYPDACTSYMHSLYKLRLVSRIWKEVVDSTPDLWALVSWGFSDDVNISNMDKSRNGLSYYLTDPAPTLETMHLRCSVENPAHEPFPLFCHHVSTVRYVNLTHIAFHPSPSPFYNLTDFSLCSIWGVEIAIEWITEVLRGSPQLERLCLANLVLQIPALSSPIAAIDLFYLKAFRLYEIDGRAIDYIIRLINAPNCVQFQLECNGIGADDYDLSLLLDSGLASFEPTIQNIIYAMSCPIVSIDVDSISWGQRIPSNFISDGIPFCHLSLRRVSFVAIVRWVERVVESTRLDRGPDLRFPGLFHISSTTLLTNAEIASRLKHFKSITHITATDSTVDVGQLLQLLGEPGPEPWFPCLEQLAVHAYGWEARQLLEMLQTRLSRSSQLIPRFVMIQPKLYGDFAGPAHRVVFDPDIWREIRAMEEVDAVYPDDEDMRADRKLFSPKYENGFFEAETVIPKALQLLRSNPTSGREATLAKRGASIIAVPNGLMAHRYALKLSAFCLLEIFA